MWWVLANYQLPGCSLTRESGFGFSGAYNPISHVTL